jgi:IS1 family transposase
VGREWFPLADFTPSRAGFNSPALHHHYYTSNDKGIAMNKLKPEKQEAIIHALVEGSSIRSVERMTGVHRDTIMRLSVNVGNACEALQRQMMRDLTCERIELDEVWCYVGKKERHVRDADDNRLVGHFWTWVAIDADTKLVPTYIVGKRDAATAQAFVSDLASRLTNRVQLSSDKLPHYIEAIEAAFGADVDYAQLVKSYEAEPMGPGRYSPPEVVGVEKRLVTGRPDWKSISTSYVERQNLTMRMSMRRFTRLTNAFSKKLENLKAAVALHFAYYNLVRKHRSLGTTPAVAAGVLNREWSLRELVWLAG